MLAVTEAARKQIAEVLSKAHAADGLAVRVIFTGKGFTLGLEAPRPEDEIFKHEGRTVLVVSKRVLQALGDKTIDVSNTEDGPELSLG